MSALPVVTRSHANAANVRLPPFGPRLAVYCTAEILMLRHVGRPAKVRFPFHLTEQDTGRSVQVAPPESYLVT